MLYALLMLLTLAALHATWQGSGFQIPLVLIAAVATLTAFVSDITTVLSISL
jgi:copper oxidase (laccase) domain-containing protein